MTCNPRVIHINGQWQAWCKPCHWETSFTNQYSLAIHWANEHKDTG